MSTDIIRALRVKKGDTQESIAEKLNVPKRTYASWEREERNFPRDILVSIANMYGVTVDYLVGRNEQKAPVPQEGSPRESPVYDRQEGIDMLKAISDESYQAMLILLRDIAKGGR